jgi:rhodanese-related sulfurtransferase
MNKHMNDLGKLLLCIALTSMLMLALTGVSSAQDGYTNINVGDAWGMINTNPDIVVLDVRTQVEYNEAHIEGAKLIPLAELPGRLGELDPEAPTIVYCWAGSRSTDACENYLNSYNGFTEVYNMLGGINAWIDAGYPTVSSEGRCFIATAAFSSDTEGRVRTLRDFRDAYLKPDSTGSSFVSLYYKVSPPIAEFIDDHPTLKPVVRAGLLPAVAVSSTALRTTLIEKIIIAGSLALVSIMLLVWAKNRHRELHIVSGVRAEKL